MMQNQLARHFGHRREWGLDRGYVLLPFRGYVFIRCKKFKGNFTMALCSFGGVSDQCGATAWVPHETGMVPLLSSENDMTEWLKETYKGSGASRARGRPGHTKAAGGSKYLLGIIHAHEWLLSRSSGLFSVEERPR